MKTKSRILTIILLSLFSFCFGQSNQGVSSFEDEIRKEIENPTSAFFYPNLINKINKEPAKITKEEIKYLYYGQIYKRGTGLSFLDNPDEDAFRRVAEQNKCSKLLKLGYPLLHKNPVQLTILFPITNCIIKNKGTDSLLLESRTKMVLEAIYETGTGATRETAIKIANIEDDLVLRGLMGIQGGKESFESFNNRTYSIWTNGDKKLYFEDCWNYKYK